VSAAGWIAVGLLGGAMAVARLAVDALLSDRPAGPFPTGILAVNLLGTLVLGVVSGAGLSGEALVIVAGGGTGSFTTFSTWMLDSERLAESGPRSGAAQRRPLAACRLRRRRARSLARHGALSREKAAFAVRSLLYLDSGNGRADDD
jgi:CrcB protein